MSKKRCFFIGHRDTSEAIIPILKDAIEHHIINLGVSEFVVGHDGSFDKIVAKTLLATKDRYPEIKLTLLIPYHPAERPVRLPNGFDDSLYPDGMEAVPRKTSIIRANRYAVEHSDYLIAYVGHTASNSKDILEYAYKLERKGSLTVTLLEHKL